MRFIRLHMNCQQSNLPHCYMLKTAAVQLARSTPKLKHSLSIDHEISTAASTISVEHVYQISGQYNRIWLLKYDYHDSSHRFSIFGQIFIFEPSFLELNQTWTQFVRTLSQDIYPFKPLTKSCLMNLSNTNQSKLDYLNI